MNTIKKDVVIIGGGPAGLAAAVELHKNGVEDIIIIEREQTLGGILRQCIHDGFGLTRFKESLSGPEYAQRFIDKVIEYKIPYKTGATVLKLSKDKKVTVASREGLFIYETKSVVLAMGCRERTRGALGIPGQRPAGVFTAGVAQAYINLYNQMIGKNILILGSGDIGLIMARRLTLEGANVVGVLEIQPYPSGLNRNIEQCLNDYEIPLFLSHTVTEIHGTNRLVGVTVSKVNEYYEPIPRSEKFYPVDTLILSVGLIPENELSLGAEIKLDERTKGAIVDENYQTTLEGVFSVGNTLHVHDLVDFVSLEAEKMAISLCNYIKKEKLRSCQVEVKTDGNIIYTLPQFISGLSDVELSLRVRKPLSDVIIEIRQGEYIVDEIPFKKAIPAEMIKISISNKKLSPLMPLEVTVR